MFHFEGEVRMRFKIYGVGMPIEIDAQSSEHAELLAYQDYSFLSDVDVSAIHTRRCDA